jgi:hypothetical protein
VDGRDRQSRGAPVPPLRKTADIALAATLHDASGALAGLIRRHLPSLRRMYAAIAVTTSPPTAARVNARLVDGGAYAGTPRANTRGPLYRLALRRALASGARRVHYLDFDRALHWVDTRPDELASVLRLAGGHSALLIGRTLAAHRSHQRPLFATESEVNARFAQRLGVRGRVDFLVPSFVLTRELAAALVRRSHADGATIYGEWPALLATLDRPLAYVECRGLDFETPDRHRAEVRRRGLAAWRRTLETDEEWTARRTMAADFERGFRATLGRRRRVAAFHYI